MAAHTPGPWRLGDAGLTVFGPPNGRPSPQTIASVRTKANARLIAAAPDLLAALQNLVFCYVPVAGGDAALDMARAAIRTATGQEG